jgi:hypothetical protein
MGTTTRLLCSTRSASLHKAMHLLAGATEPLRNHAVTHALIHESRHLRDHLVAVLGFLSTADVDQMCHRLQVVGINASMVATQMVKFKPLGDWPLVAFIDNAMRRANLLAMRAEHRAIPAGVGGSLPQPAPCHRINDVLIGRLSPPVTKDESVAGLCDFAATAATQGFGWNGVLSSAVTTNESARVVFKSPLRNIGVLGDWSKSAATTLAQAAGIWWRQRRAEAVPADFACTAPEFSVATDVANRGLVVDGAAAVTARVSLGAHCRRFLPVVLPSVGHYPAGGFRVPQVYQLGGV